MPVDPRRPALELAYRHISRHPASGSSRYAVELKLLGLRAWHFVGRRSKTVGLFELENLRAAILVDTNSFRDLHPSEGKTHRGGRHRCHMTADLDALGAVLPAHLYMQETAAIHLCALLADEPRAVGIGDEPMAHHERR